MTISHKQNRSTKNSLVPNLISIIVKNHNGYVAHQESVPPTFYYGTMNRLREQYKGNYNITANNGF